MAMWRISASLTSLITIFSFLNKIEASTCKAVPGGEGNFQRSHISSVACQCSGTDGCDTTVFDDYLSKDYAQVVMTDAAGKRFEQQAPLTWKFAANPTEATDSVHSLKTLRWAGSQSFQGFGTGLSDAAAININGLTDSAKDVFLNEFFNSTGGNAYQIVRTNIGSCTHSNRPYTYDETEGDFDLEDFALSEEDTDLKMPILNQIKNVLESENRNLSLIGALWSAPSWMKSTDLQDSGNIVAGAKYFDTLNNYLAKYVEAYKNMGFNFWGISPLNEPIVGITGDSGFPNTAWFPSYFSRFIYETMAPYFLENHPEINILISETGRTASPFYVAIMADYRNAHGYNLTNTTFPNVNYYGLHFNGFSTPNFWTRIGELQGVDFHPVTTEAMYEIDSKHSAKDYLGSWTAAEAYAINLVYDMNGNSTIYADWNMMLNQNGGPSWVGKYATSATYSDPDDNDVFYKNPIFYVQGHFSKLIKNGWNKRGSKSDGHGTVLAKPGVMLSVMESPDVTKRVAVMVNRYSSDQEVNYWDRDLKSEVNLVVPAYSVTSVYYSLV